MTQEEKAPSLSEELESLLRVLPGPIREVVERHPGTSEISLLLERPLVLSFGGRGNFIEFHDLVVDQRHIEHLTTRLSALKDDGRAGIDRTAHRISVIRDRLNNVIGLTVRIGRFIPVLTEEEKSLILSTGGSLLVIGAPESGKTTLLRNIVAILAEEYGPNLSVIDTSNEIGGLGQVPHPSLKTARWHQVRDPKEQPVVIRRAIANHAPQVLVLDEIGYNEDVEEVEAAARRGIRVIASVHGLDLADVLENPRYAPLLGRPDLEKRVRIYRPAFKAAIEVRAKGKMFFIPNLARAIDLTLMGEKPEGHRLGPNWKEDEPDYPEDWGLTQTVLPSRPESVVARHLVRGSQKLKELYEAEGMNEASVTRLVLLALAGNKVAQKKVELYSQTLQGEAP